MELFKSWDQMTEVQKIRFLIKEDEAKQRANKAASRRDDSEQSIAEYIEASKIRNKNYRNNGVAFLRIEARPIHDQKFAMDGEVKALKSRVANQTFKDFSIEKKSDRKKIYKQISSMINRAGTPKSVKKRLRGGVQRTIDEALRLGALSHLKNDGPEHIALAFGDPEEMKDLDRYLREEWWPSVCELDQSEGSESFQERLYEALTGPKPEGKRKAKKDQKEIPESALGYLGGVISAPPYVDDSIQFAFLDSALNYLKKEYGENLLGVVFHDVEERFAKDPADAQGGRHFHFFIKPKLGQRLEDLHPGLKASLDLIKTETKEHYTNLRQYIETEITRQKVNGVLIEKTRERLVDVWWDPETNKVDRHGNEWIVKPEVQTPGGKFDARKALVRKFKRTENQLKLDKEFDKTLFARRRMVYSAAMSKIQDRFFYEVASQFEFTRLGPARKRYNPLEWSAHRQHRQLVDNNREMVRTENKTRKQIGKHKQTLTDLKDQSVKVVQGITRTITEQQRIRKEIEAKNLELKLTDENYKKKKEEIERELAEHDRQLKAKIQVQEKTIEQLEQKKIESAKGLEDITVKTKKTKEELRVLMARRKKQAQKIDVAAQFTGRVAGVAKATQESLQSILPSGKKELEEKAAKLEEKYQAESAQLARIKEDYLRDVAYHEKKTKAEQAKRKEAEESVELLYGALQTSHEIIKKLVPPEVFDRYENRLKNKLPKPSPTKSNDGH